MTRTEQLRLHMILFSPSVFFPAVFLAGVALTLLQLTSNIRSFHDATLFLLVLSTISYWIGSLVGKKPLHPLPLATRYFLVRRKLVLSYLVAVVSMSLLLYEFYAQGGIPVFSEDVELKRFATGESGYIHLLALSFKPIISIYIAALLLRKRLELNFGRHTKVITFLTLVGLALLASTGTRGHLILTLTVSISAFLIHRRRCNLKILVAAAACGFVFLSLVKFYREYLLFGEHYTSSMADIWFLGERFLFFVPGYLTITMNYNIFDRLVESFIIHGSNDYFLGRFLLYPIISLWPGKQMTLGQYQNQIWDTGFYANLTSTYLGVPFADFGVVGVIIIPFVFGLMARKFYNLAFKTFSFVYIMLYAQVVVFLLLCIYNFPLSGFHNYFYFFLLYYFSFIIRTESACVVSTR